MDTGIVEKIIDKRNAIVSINMQECGGCMSKKNCNIYEKGDNLIEAEYEEDLKVGDNVQMIFKPQKRLISSTLIFMVPIFILIIFYFIGFLFFKDERISIIFTFAFFILYFIVLIPVMNKFKNSSDLKPKIIKIE